MLEHTLRGLTPREISLLLDVSTQTVYLHLRRLRDAGELDEEQAS